MGGVPGRRVLHAAQRIERCGLACGRACGRSGFCLRCCQSRRRVAGSVDVAAGSASDSAPYHFQLTASHSDSPCFKVKTNGELEGPAGYVRLDTEAYGSMMDYTSFDRPLSLAGRVLVREGARIESRLVALNRDVALIPSLAIHMDGGVNKGFAPNRASDLFAALRGRLGERLARHDRGRCPRDRSAQIVSRDLFLVNRERGRVWVSPASSFPRPASTTSCAPTLRSSPL